MSFAQFNGVASNIGLNVSSLVFSNGESTNGEQKSLTTYTGTVTNIADASGGSTPLQFVNFTGLKSGTYVFVIPASILATNNSAPLTDVSCYFGSSQVVQELALASTSTGITIATGFTYYAKTIVFVQTVTSSNPNPQINLSCLTTASWSAALLSGFSPLAVLIK